MNHLGRESGIFFGCERSLLDRNAFSRDTKGDEVSLDKSGLAWAGTPRRACAARENDLGLGIATGEVNHHGHRLSIFLENDHARICMADRIVRAAQNYDAVDILVRILHFGK